MNYLTRQIVFQEIPNEISMTYLITGCPMRCFQCHSRDAWDPACGSPLQSQSLSQDILQFQDWITCVLFMGGEWELDSLMSLLKIVKQFKLKTALYSGREHLPEVLLQELHFVKLGRFDFQRGGLHSPTTNQRLLDLQTGENLNHYFQRGPL